VGETLGARIDVSQNSSMTVVAATSMVAIWKTMVYSTLSTYILSYLSGM